MLKLFGRSRIDPASQLKEIFEGYDLPTFQAIYLEAMRLVRDEQTSTDILASHLSTDPGLTVRLLQTVNSAAFGLRSRVTSVHHAASLLGRSHIESILISLATRSALPREPTAGFDPVPFWHTAARRAAIASALANRVAPAERSECFTGALLQDMAIPLLCTRKGPTYVAVLDRWRAGDGALHLLERETFGWDHAQVAALMCREWGVPDRIAESIAAHHGFEDPEVHSLLPVTLAACLTENAEDGGVEAFVEKAHAATGLDVADLQALVEESARSAEQIADHFD